MKRLEFLLISLLCITFANAQIGYQVSLLNTATGEPRANEKVTAKIELSNSDGEVVYSETQTGVTNDFGVLSLTIGNAQSLSAIDWSKYPMFISVTVDNVLIGKTQVMSVPYANAVVPLSKDILIGTWSGTIIRPSYNEINTTEYVFDYNGIVKKRILYNSNEATSFQIGVFHVIGNEIICLFPSEGKSGDDIGRNIIDILYHINGKIYIHDGKSNDTPSLTKQ